MNEQPAFEAAVVNLNVQLQVFETSAGC